MANEQNLIPAKKGEIRNPKGKPKGTKHLSTIIRELAENVDWSKTTLKNKEELQAKYGKNGFQAMCYVALSKGMAGDTKAMEWLAKYGYGHKLDITSDGERLEGIKVEFVGIDEQQDSQNTNT